MRPFLTTLSKYILTGAIIGAILGFFLAGGMPEGPPAGAFMGAMSGLGIVAIRTDNRRIMSKSHARLGTSADEAASGFIHGNADRH